MSDDVPRGFTPALPDSTEGGRLGGAPPRAIEDHPLFDTHRYLLTLPAGCASWAGHTEVSVLLRHGFTIADDDLTYPEMAMRALVHPPSPRGDRSDLGWPGLRSAALGEHNLADEAPALVRTGAQPVLIQNEPSYAAAVLADGHSFLFQIDEEGWPVDGPLEHVIEEYLWGYGSVYFYGTPATDGQVRDVHAGFLDF